MIDRLSASECVLCGSCGDACPVSAISFTKDYLDFRYPQIDAAVCTQCNLCEKACPVLNLREADPQAQHRVYAAQNPDGEIRRRSTSGGIFRGLAAAILDQGGYVCGAVFEDHFRVRHLVSNRQEDIDAMMGSKYAQSDLTGVYQEIRKLLRADQLVLFTGCPCQVAGLHQFLGRAWDNLITAEVICHGVPSQTMFQSYLQLQEQKYRAKAETISFRDKKYGWHRSAVRIQFANGVEYCMPITADAYMKGFLGGIYLKESCYDCRFKEFSSGSDLTLGDFWGVEARRPELDDNIGLSAVIANSEKGAQLLHRCGMDLWDDQLDAVIRYNRNLMVPTKRSPERDTFYTDAKARGYVRVIKDRLMESPVQKLCREGRYLLRCILYAVTGRGKPLY